MAQPQETPRDLPMYTKVVVVKKDRKAVTVENVTQQQYTDNTGNVIMLVYCEQHNEGRQFMFSWEDVSHVELHPAKVQAVAGSIITP